MKFELKKKKRIRNEKFEHTKAEVEEGWVASFRRRIDHIDMVAPIDLPNTHFCY